MTTNKSDADRYGIDAGQTEPKAHHPERSKPKRRRVVVAQGPNVGYWQAVGSSRSAAKRSKRP